MNLFKPSAIFCLFAAFLALGLAVQHAGLHAPMYYDSAGNIAEKRGVFVSEGLAGVLTLFPQRPLPIATFYVNFLISDVAPFSFRVVNIAILAGTSMLVVLLIRLIQGLPSVRQGQSSGAENLVAIFAGLLFLVHPLQTYLTLYIWQRMALMACFFSYACLLVYLAVRSGRWSCPRAGYALCLALFVCAVLSKENSVTLPLIFILAEIAFFPQPWSAVARRAGILAIITLGVVGAASVIQHPHGNAELGSGILATITRYYAESGLTVRQVIYTQCRVLFSYLSLIVFPLPPRVQLISPQVLSLSLTDPPVTAAAVAGVIALLMGGIVLLKNASGDHEEGPNPRRSGGGGSGGSDRAQQAPSAGACFQRQRPIWGFGILFFLTNLIPEGLLVPQYAFFGYRPVLPMLGILLILADCMLMLWGAAARNPRWRLVRAGGLAFLAGVVVLLGTSTALRADVWSDPLRFWKETVDRFPPEDHPVEPKVAAQALGNLGAALYDAGRYPEAADRYERAMELYPEDPRIMVSLSAVYAERGDLGEAEALLSRAIALSPASAQAYKNLGIVYMKQNRPDQALETLRTGLKHARHDASFHQTMGQVQLMRKQGAAAIAAFGRAIELNPRSAPLHYDLGQAYLAEGNSAAAEDVCRKALQLKPDYWEAHNVLGILYASQGKPAEALAQFRKALAIDPGNAQLRSNVETAMKQMQGRPDTSGQPQAP